MKYCISFSVMDRARLRKIGTNKVVCLIADNLFINTPKIKKNRNEFMLPRVSLWFSWVLPAFFWFLPKCSTAWHDCWHNSLDSSFQFFNFFDFVGENLYSYITPQEKIEWGWFRWPCWPRNWTIADYPAAGKGSVEAFPDHKGPGITTCHY